LDKVARIAITAGEPAGIGPELCLRIAQQQHDCEIIVIAAPELLAYYADLLNIQIELVQADLTVDAQPHQAGRLLYIPCQLAKKVQAGQLDSANGQYVIDTLQVALDGCLNNTFAAVVTGPVHKGVINDAGIEFTGHTEFFADGSSIDKVVMMLATPNLRVALATTHLPLSQVSRSITQQSLQQVIDIIQRSFIEQLNIKQPRIAVCGLNPHAGENGHMGHEEIEVIEPVIKNAQRYNPQITGPWPADTVFVKDKLKQFDVVLAMYHDQGLPVLKHDGFGQAVNITLGLPFVRTSVDHGTALDIAGKAKADIGSIKCALEMAIQYAGG
jgi:4-hydroxythreonine-4-phosphate dehydrogenase